MSSLMSTAVAAMVSTLGASPAVAPQVARVRLRPLSATASTAVAVRPLDAEAAERDFADFPIAWSCRVSVECYAKAPATTAPDVAVDGVVQAVYARLMADTTLGGQVGLIQPASIAYDFDADGEQTACATLVFSVRQTAVNPSVF